MKNIITLNESDITRIVKRVISENQKVLLKESNVPFSFDTLDSGFADLDGSTFFSKVIPKIYQEDPPKFVNACASRLSLALNKAGVTDLNPVAFNTLYDYTHNEGKGAGNTYSKGTPLITSALQMKNFLTKKYGNGEDFENDGTITDKLKGRKGMFVITEVPGWRASGHADIHDGKGNCGNYCHFGEGGKLRFWELDSQVNINAKKCGWGNDIEGYKLSNWKCNDDPTKPSPAKNAKKCGYGDDVKSYRLNGWKCKN